ncbi:hypothetical protein FG379_003571 [Cryptosporidium bovis]|uniref:uncharacterized protein n=1 Tax=Cryptosporidium bovis TaxID=310047 RepID=UPI00351A096C|nr:hypothetical protein FG379_003571 [Cryptosporidium bovis]
MLRDQTNIADSLGIRILNVINSIRNREDVIKSCENNFGKKTTSILKCVIPVNIGFVLSVFIKKMVKTTLIFLGTSSIIYILMTIINIRIIKT